MHWHNAVRLGEVVKITVIPAGVIELQTKTRDIRILTREGIAGHLVIVGILRICGRRYRITADLSPRLVPT